MNQQLKDLATAVAEILAKRWHKQEKENESKVRDLTSELKADGEAPVCGDRIDRKASIPKRAGGKGTLDTGSNRRT